MAAALEAASQTAVIRICTRQHPLRRRGGYCRMEEIVKSLIFRRSSDDDAVLVLIGGADRVDTAKLARFVGAKIGRADADFVRRTTGYAIGGVPPLGYATLAVVVMDEGLMALSTAWTAAGTPHAVFEATPADLARITGAQIAAVAATLLA